MPASAGRGGRLRCVPVGVLGRGEVRQVVAQRQRGLHLGVRVRAEHVHAVLAVLRQQPPPPRRLPEGAVLRRPLRSQPPRKASR
eukprot:scaffold7215_cov366-Prasinococcus_capsulatus_cf.AAC.21